MWIRRTRLGTIWPRATTNLQMIPYPDFDDAEDISQHALPLLQVGENVLAVAVYNDAEDSSDLAIAANLTFNPPKPVEGTELCGEYEEVVTLTLKDSPYTASCDVTFHPNSVLNIEAGVQIFSSDGVDIVIQGEVNMLGGEEHPILFKGNLSEWHGVTIDYSDLEDTVRSVIRHVTFDGGEDLLKLESTGESNVLVENCKFDNWSHLALDWDDCPLLTIRSCEFGFKYS